MDLFSSLQQALGARGSSMQQGSMPSGSNPRGSQQLYMKGAEAVKHEIFELSKLSATFRQIGENQCDREVTACVHKLQGVLEKLQTKLKDMQDDQI